MKCFYHSSSAAWPSLKGPGHFRSRWHILRNLYVSKGKNWASWGSVLEAALQTAAAISSMFTASSIIHLNQSFWCPQGKKIKINSVHRALLCIGTELQSTLLTGKCQRGTPAVFLELRTGIISVALGMPSAQHPRVLPCLSPSVPWLGVKLCANVLDELINVAVEVVKIIHKEGMLLSRV